MTVNALAPALIPPPDIEHEQVHPTVRSLYLDLDSLAERKARQLGSNAVPMGLGDFFFSPDDPLNPDYDEDEEDDDDEEDDEE